MFDRSRSGTNQLQEPVIIFYNVYLINIWIKSIFNNLKSKWAEVDWAK